MIGLAAARAPIELGPGDRAGGYRLLERLGSGGMGEVFLAEDVEIGRRVALKVLHARHLGNARAYERFLREARLANRIRHPRIVDVIGFGHLPDGRPWLVMEHVDGANLHAVWAQPLSLARFFAVADQLVEALEAAHAAGIVHRDLKPSNIHLTSDGSLKVLDFGAARSTEGGEDDRLTGTGEVVATARYMAPEQATGDPVDARGDLYSVGMILWELLVGRLPFQGRSFGEWVLLHSTAVPEPPSRQRDRKMQEAIPPALDAIVLRCLAKRPDHRFSSASELKRALGRARRRSRASVRRPLSAALAVLAVALVAVAARPRHAPAASAPPRRSVAPLLVRVHPVAVEPEPEPRSEPAPTLELEPLVVSHHAPARPARPHPARRVRTAREPDARLLKNPFGGPR